MKIGQLAASETTTINVQYLPQYLYFVATTVPTAFKVNVAGDGVISDLDGDGVDIFGVQRIIGRETNGYTIALSDGLIPNKVVDITIANAVAATVDVYGFSREMGDIYVQTLRQSVLANSGANFADFAFMGFPSAAAGDRFIITFEDDTVQEFHRDEITCMLQFSQNEVTGAYNLDNLEGEIKLVNFIPAALQTVYLQRYIPVGDLPGGVYA